MTKFFGASNFWTGGRATSEHLVFRFRNLGYEHDESALTGNHEPSAHVVGYFRQSRVVFNLCKCSRYRLNATRPRTPETPLEHGHIAQCGARWVIDDGEETTTSVKVEVVLLIKDSVARILVEHVFVTSLPFDPPPDGPSLKGSGGPGAPWRPRGGLHKGLVVVSRAGANAPPRRSPHVGPTRSRWRSPRFVSLHPEAQERHSAGEAVKPFFDPGAFSKHLPKCASNDAFLYGEQCPPLYLPNLYRHLRSHV